MIFEDSIPLFNSTELDIIKSSWKDERANVIFQNNHKDVSYHETVVNDLPQEYVDRFLDWIETKIGKKIYNRKKYDLLLKRFKEGEYLDYHTDSDYSNTSWNVEYAAGFHVNDDYEGGEFVVYENGKERAIGNQVGVPYIFSADTHHKINKVKSKIRYSIILFVYNNSIDTSTLI